MPSGTFRRPPQLWEQKLASLVSINNVGTIAGGATDGVGSDLPPGDGGGGGSEPAPIAATSVAFGTPSTPTLSGTVQGIRVSWNGNNASGEQYPTDAYVEVHIATSGATFTPDSTTLRGKLLNGAGFFTIFGLTAGTTYYVRLVGRDAQGIASTASTAASGTTGLTSAGDYGTATIDAGAVSFNARSIGGITTSVSATAPSSPVAGDVWLDTSSGAVVYKRYSGSAWATQAWGSDSLSANCITATQIAAGAVTAGAIAAGSITTAKLDASAVTADKIAAGAITAAKISAGAIDGQTITGATIRTASTGARVAMNDGGRAAYLDIYSGNGSLHSLYGNLGDLVISPASRCVIGTGVQIQGDLTFLTGGNITATSLSTSGNISGSSGLSITGSAVDMQGVYTNNTTGIDSVGINASYRLRRISSTQAIKYDITALTKSLSASVDEARRSTVATVNPAGILDVAVTEFSVIDDGVATERRVLGFIADDVADKLPIAVTRDEAGVPAGVLDTSLIAALLAVVQQQQQTITELTARVEALEAK